MNKYIMTIFLLSFSLIVEAQEMNWKILQLTIHDIEVKRGGVMSVYVFLEEGFPIKHDQAVKFYRFDVSNESHILEIEIPDRTFALKVHHDENMSGKVTKNWTGIFPTEGIGFSSGAKIRFGPPSFKQAAMTLPHDNAAHIYMVYP